MKFHCAARLNSICSSHIYSKYVTKYLDEEYPLYKRIECIFHCFVRLKYDFSKLCRLNIFLAMVTGILCSAPIAVASCSVGSVWKKAMETRGPAVKSVATLEGDEVLRRWWWDQVAPGFTAWEIKKNCLAGLWRQEGLRLNLNLSKLLQSANQTPNYLKSKYVCSLLF